MLFLYYIMQTYQYIINAVKSSQPSWAMFVQQVARTCSYHKFIKGADIFHSLKNLRLWSSSYNDANSKDAVACSS